jgi:chromosome partitioning protein
VKILAFYNMKGGVGKTASCVNLAYLSAAEGRPTLICDLDPQGATSFYYRINPSGSHDDRKLLKGGRKAAREVRGTDFPNLDLLPADLSYRNLDIVLDGKKRSKKRLREMLDTFTPDYSYVFLDCPPNLTLVSENIFVAAHYIWVPMIPTVLSVLSFKKLLSFFKAEKYDTRKLHPFFSMVERRKLIHRQTVEEKDGKKKRVMQTAIPYLSEVEKMGLYRAPLTQRYPNSRASKAYHDLWREMKALMGEKH